MDYDVTVDHHAYSVPHTLVSQGIDVRLTAVGGGLIAVERAERDPSDVVAC